MSENDHDRGLSIIVGDSGGASGLSIATVLDQLMKRIQVEAGLPDTPLIEEYFDIVAGAGTAAIVMTLVGRLGVTTEHAVEALAKLSKEVFSERAVGKPTFKASKLEKALQSAIESRTGNKDEPVLDGRENSKRCKTMVFAMSQYNMNAGIPTIFRSYDTSHNPGPQCAIWQALRAATAHPEMFRGMEIVSQGIAEPFVDAAMGCGNPIEHVLAEVKRIYPNRRIACIVSIGSGHPSTIQIPDPDSLQRVLPTNVMEAMKKIAADNERMAQSMATRFGAVPDVYFRLNVDQGMQSIRLGDWDRLGEVQAHTRTYMGKAETESIVRRAVKVVKERKGVIPVEQADGEIQPPPTHDQQAGVKECPAPTLVYTDRLKPIEQVTRYLTGSIPAGRRTFVFHGLGGAGKTQLALQAVERTREHWSDVVYVDATSPETLTTTLRLFATARKLGGTHEDALRWLGSHTAPWLLVFDNADDVSLGLQRYFPKGSHGSILITTRSREVVPLARGPNSDCNVSSMEPDESLQLLLTVVRIDYETLSDEEKDAAKGLVQDLGHLALAVVQTGAYIRRRSCSFRQYQALYKEQPQRMLRRQSMIPVELNDYEKTVYVAWAMSYDLLSERAKEMLWLMAYLQRDRITQEIFRRAAARINSFQPLVPLSDIDDQALPDVQIYLSNFLDSNGAWDMDSFLTTMAEITSNSLVLFDRVNGAYELHLLVQEWIRTTIPHSAELALARSTLLLTLSINRKRGIEDYAFRRSLELHVNSVTQRQAQVNADSAACFGLVFYETGRYEKAMGLQLQVVERATEELGNNHPRTRLAMAYLVITYLDQGLYRQAEAMQLQVVDGYKQALGDKHPNTLAAMDNLSSTYAKQGLYKKAETLLVQVLEGTKQTLGDKHPRTLIAMLNLAGAYSGQSLYEQAETLEVQVLEARKQALGDKHPDTLSAMGSLAATYSAQGLYKQAEMLKVQVLEERKQALGDKHLDTLSALGSLAATYFAQGLYEQAETLEVQVLEGRKQVLGDKHPDTLAAMYNLAATYFAQGLYKRAESLQVLVLEGRKQALGDEHPDTLSAMGGLAAVYFAQGLYKQAEPLEVQVLEARKQALGDKHPDTLSAMGSLAATYSAQGLYKQAEMLKVQMLEARKQTLGDKHLDTLTAMGSLAITYFNQGQYKQAETLEVQVLEGRKQTLGDKHPSTLTTMRNLALTYFQLNLWDQAEMLYVQALEGMRQVQGVQDPNILPIMKNLARTYKHLGDSRQAEYKALRAEITKLDPSEPAEPDSEPEPEPEPAEQVKPSKTRQFFRLVQALGIL
ncbi:hypothetical protein FRC07_014813 [Ceratobasidium sp. 392]|nr:hypothetical protein FRC07_014813 [Ceratobasidium sp. 392]